MDVIGENEAIQQILNQGIDLDQLELETLLTESDANLVLSDIGNDGALYAPMGGVGHNQMYKSLPQQIRTDSGLGIALFDNLGFNDEENLVGSGIPVPISHLPDSPPDSSSEPYSPPESKLDPNCVPYHHHQGMGGVVAQQPMTITSTNHNNSSVNQTQMPMPNRTTMLQNAHAHHQRQHSLPTSIPMMTGIPTPASLAQTPIPVPTVVSAPENNIPVPQTNIPVPSGIVLQQSVVPTIQSSQGQAPGVPSVSANVPPQSVTQQFMNFLANSQTIAAPTSLAQIPMTETINSSLTRDGSFVGHVPKKRKHSISPNNTVNQNMLNKLMQVKQEPVDPPQCIDGDYSAQSNMDVGSEYGMYDQPTGDGMPYTDTIYQSLKWQPYQTNKWNKLLDANGQELPPPSYRVEADKGFNFSVPDDSFVCQKKNHFQVTGHLCISGVPHMVQTESGSKKLDSVKLHIHGIKMEAMNSYIRVEQSQADRSKKPFVPAKLDIHPDNVVKATIGRLHFSETTSNNMRKKGKPNPDQRYFMLVVSIQAHCGKEEYLIASQVSERIIVRASNPGQFENDADVTWQKGSNQDSIFHAGRVGINTERPDEALVVHGNLKITGHLMQPSDKRAKQDFQELNPSEQLQNIGKLRVMRYKYIPSFAEQAGLPECDQVETGVIAQEVMDVLPDAVQKTGTVNLPNGGKIEHFLVVNKDRIYMENVGAVKELVRLTDNLETRIDELEKMNRKLAKLKRVDSLKSNTSIGTLSRNGSNKSNKVKEKRPGSGSSSGGGSCSSKGKGQEGVSPCLSPRSMQLLIVALILIMLFCFAAIATLYVLDTNDDIMPSLPSGTNGTFQKVTSTIQTSSTSMTPKVSDVPLATPGSCTDDCSVIYCCMTDLSNTLPDLISNDKTLNSTFIPQVTVSPVAPVVRASTVSTTPTRMIEVINPPMNPGGDIPNPMLNNNNNTGMDGTISMEGRKRRSAGRYRRMTSLDIDVTYIRLDRTKDICTTDCSSMENCTPAKKCTSSGNGNFTYDIEVGAHAPVKFADLELDTSQPSLMVLCTWTGAGTCTEEAQTMQTSTDSLNLSQGTSHTYSLPVGYFQNSTFTFRIMPNNSEPQDTSYYCALEREQIDHQYHEYRFHFTRDLSSCPA